MKKIIWIIMFVLITASFLVEAAAPKISIAIGEDKSSYIMDTATGEKLSTGADIWVKANVPMEQCIVSKKSNVTGTLTTYDTTLTYISGNDNDGYYYRMVFIGTHNWVPPNQGTVICEDLSGTKVSKDFTVHAATSRAGDNPDAAPEPLMKMAYSSDGCHHFSMNVITDEKATCRLESGTSFSTTGSTSHWYSYSTVSNSPTCATGKGSLTRKVKCTDIEGNQNEFSINYIIGNLNDAIFPEILDYKLVNIPGGRTIYLSTDLGSAPICKISTDKEEKVANNNEHDDFFKSPDAEYALRYWIKGLENGQHKYYLKCMDKTWKTDSAPREISFTVGDFVTGISPESGTVLPAGTKAFNLEFTTAAKSACKVSKTPLDDSKIIGDDGLDISNTGPETHSTTLSALADGQTYTYYIKCGDSILKAYTDSIPVSFSVANSDGTDTTPPTILSVVSQGASYDLHVVTNEYAQCRYSSSDILFDEMTDSIGGTKTDHFVSTGVFDDGDYTIYIKCKDSAGNENPQSKEYSFTIDSPPPPPPTQDKTPPKIIEIKTQSTDYDLNIITNEEAYCRFDTTDAQYSQLLNNAPNPPGGPLTEHAVEKDFFDEGEHTIYIKCQDLSPSKNENTASYKYTFTKEASGTIINPNFEEPPTIPTPIIDIQPVVNAEPTPTGDVDNSGTVDINDVTTVLQGTETQDPIADVNGDNTVDHKDVLLVVTKWLSEIIPNTNQGNTVGDTGSNTGTTSTTDNSGNTGSNTKGTTGPTGSSGSSGSSGSFGSAGGERDGKCGSGENWLNSPDDCLSRPNNGCTPEGFKPGATVRDYNLKKITYSGSCCPGLEAVNNPLAPPYVKQSTSIAGTFQPKICLQKCVEGSRNSDTGCNPAEGLERIKSVAKITPKETDKIGVCQTQECLDTFVTRDFELVYLNEVDGALKGRMEKWFYSALAHGIVPPTNYGMLSLQNFNTAIEGLPSIDELKKWNYQFGGIYQPEKVREYMMNFILGEPSAESFTLTVKYDEDSMSIKNVGYYMFTLSDYTGCKLEMASPSTTEPYSPQSTYATVSGTHDGDFFRSNPILFSDNVGNLGGGSYSFKFTCDTPYGKVRTQEKTIEVIRPSG
ncbi:hypothetical protein ACFL1B_03160 [Nanoarchaeota archaeon]